MKKISLVIVLSFFFRIGFTQNHETNKWEVTILTDAIGSFNHLYSLLYSDVSGTITFDRINSTQNQVVHFQFTANPTLLVGYKLKENLEAVIGMEQIPIKSNNTYLLGARFLHQHKYLSLKYTAAFRFDTKKITNAYGLHSIVSASYIYKNLLVLSLEHNTSFLYFKNRQSQAPDLFSIFFDAHPVLRIGVTF